MRYFLVLAWAGRLHQPAVVDAGVWDPQRVQYYDEPTADKILSLMVTDRKVSTMEEIDMAVEQSKGSAGWRKLWVPEALEGDVAERVRRAKA